MLRTEARLRPLCVLETLEGRLLMSVQADASPFSLPGGFVENQGQWADASVRYAYMSANGGVLCTSTGPVFQVDLPTTDPQPGPAGRDGIIFYPRFEGAQAVGPTGIDPQGAVGFLRGGAEGPRIGVPTYSRVEYDALYEGVDLLLAGSPSDLKYEFHVAAGASWRQIVISYQGIDSLSLDAEGNLLIRTPAGTLTDLAPRAWQETPAGRVPVDSRYALLDGHTFAFDLGAYDPSQGLVIDPRLSWLTYVGGNGFEDSAQSVKVDLSTGDAVVSGIVETPGLATPGAFRATSNLDSYVARFHPDGRLAWWTYFGGNGSDDVSDMALDAAGDIYLTGGTSSSDLATPGAWRTVSDGDDVFVAKLRANGASLAWCTLFGGDDTDSALAIGLDAAGNVTIAGHTYSTDLATPGAYRPKHSTGVNTDAFVATFTAGGSKPVLHVLRRQRG